MQRTCRPHLAVWWRQRWHPCRPLLAVCFRFPARGHVRQCTSASTRMGSQPPSFAHLALASFNPGPTRPSPCCFAVSSSPAGLIPPTLSHSPHLCPPAYTQPPTPAQAGHLGVPGGVPVLAQHLRRRRLPHRALHAHLCLRTQRRGAALRPRGRAQRWGRVPWGGGREARAGRQAAAAAAAGLELKERACSPAQAVQRSQGAQPGEVPLVPGRAGLDICLPAVACKARPG